MSIQALPGLVGAQYQTALIRDESDAPWMVRAALDAAAGAALEASAGLLRLLSGRVPFAVPEISGTATSDKGTTVAVYPLLGGNPSVWRELKTGSDLARSIGIAIAGLHDVDPQIVEESGLPIYDADSYRARRLSALDRAASTGHVPAGLLSRWERALEEVTLWKFATCVSHGSLEGPHVLSDGTVTAIDSWERACVSDPAEDFAALFALADSGAFDTVLEAYSGARRERPDVHLERRIRLSAELHRVSALLDAINADDSQLIDARSAALHRFADSVENDDALAPSPFVRQRRPAATVDEPVDPDDVVALDAPPADDETIEIPIGRNRLPMPPATGSHPAPRTLTERDGVARSGEDDASGDDSQKN